MWFGYSILPVTAVSGLIAGGGLFAFIASALAAASALWLPRASDVVIPTLYANLDPQTPDGALLLSAFRESLNRVRRTRHPLLLRLTAFAREAKPAFSLDLTREGDAELACGSRKTALKQPGVWLPDHPLPLALPRTRSLTLRFDPRGPTRIRVSTDCLFELRTGQWFGMALLAVAACAADVSWLLAAVLGFAFQTYLLEQQTHRSPSDLRVKRG